MRVRPLIGAAAGVAFAATLLGAPATMAGGPVTRMVDGDGKAKVGDCNAGAAASSTIQHAIDVSGPGDTILVCPGTYQEQLTVEEADGLTIRSVTPWAANVLSPMVMEQPAWLLGIVHSTDVTVQWMRFTALATLETLVPAGGTSCTNVDGAIAVVGSTDVEIRSNRIGARGAHTLGECGYDGGIIIGSPFSAGAAMAGEQPTFEVASARVVNNVVSDFKTAGIMTLGLRTSFDVVQNSIQFAHASDVSGRCSQTASAAAPKASTKVRRLIGSLMGPAGPGLPFGYDCIAFGILDAVGTSGTIRYNEVWSNAMPTLISGVEAAPALLAGIVEFGQGAAVEALSPEFPAQTDAPVVTNNRVRGALGGYALIGADEVRLKGNTAKYAGFGVFVAQTRDARVTDNRVGRSFVGFMVMDQFYTFFPDRGGSSDNAFRRNEIPGSGYLEASCVDQTTGSGTAGTANTWTDNSAPADSSEPLGICGAVSPP